MAIDSAPRPALVLVDTFRPRSRTLIDVETAAIGVLSVALAMVVATRITTWGWRLAWSVGLLGAGGATVWLVRHARDRGGEELTIVFGVLGLCVGLGIGARHLQVAGWSVTAISGLVALAAGTALVVVGTWSRVRATSRWRRLWALPVAALTIWFVVIPATMALMVTNVPPTPLGSETPADLGLTYEDATLRTTDGVTLSAWYVPSRNGAAIVLRHGATSTRASTLPHAQVLAEHGYGVLLTDARGHGASGGVAMDWGWWGDLDLDAAVSYLSVRPDVHADRIGVVGMSMGGEEALGAAASDPRIRAVVAEGVSQRTLADSDLTLPDHAGRWLNIARDGVQFGVADLLTDAASPIGLRSAVVAIAPRPVLVISGGEALGGAEVLAGPRLRAASPATVELWHIAGSGHTAGLATVPDEWEARVTGFLDEALGDASGE